MHVAGVAHTHTHTHTDAVGNFCLYKAGHSKSMCLVHVAAHEMSMTI